MFKSGECSNCTNSSVEYTSWPCSNCTRAPQTNKTDYFQYKNGEPYTYDPKIVQNNYPKY